MEKKQTLKISLSTFLLILAIIAIIIMGIFIYKLNNDKTTEVNKSTELQAQVNSLNGTVNDLQEKLDSISNNKNQQFKLQITETSWSGWTNDYKPEEVTKEYDVVLGKEFNISSYFTFVITEINSNTIVINTTKPFSDKEDGIDLSSKKTTFTIYLDREIELTTPTMDAGDIYRLSLIK